MYQKVYDGIVKIIASATNAVRTKSTKQAVQEEKSIAAKKEKRRDSRCQETDHGEKEASLRCLDLLV